MEYYSLTNCLFWLALLTVFLTRSTAQADESTFKITSHALEEEFSVEGASSSVGRSLLWGRAFHYYISYGALLANRVPCPPRSGRSYYTHNCYGARGPVHPYTRGCSAITRCRR
ncbi:hypothetical protein ACJIZ3_014891 [Penstemon smallii]|uniref:Uncharacterized protein n=1 Tax=Penstemon smallii TaxID=265156 RepID=A0ABD3RL60_9LAMI